MGRRTAKKGLCDAVDLIQAMQIPNQIIPGVDSFQGDPVEIQLEPPEFVRLFQILRIRRLTMEVHVSKQGHLHVAFQARGKCVSCVVLSDSPEFEALTTRQTGVDGPRQPDLGQSRPRLVHCEPS